MGSLVYSTQADHLIVADDGESAPQIYPLIVMMVTGWLVGTIEVGGV